MRVNILILLLATSSGAYEPQFAIPDTTIDQNFKNLAAEAKATNEALDTVEASLDTAAQLSSTQTFTGQNTFQASTTVSSFTATGSASFTSSVSTVVFSGWVDFGIHTHGTTSGISSCAISCGSGEIGISGGCFNDNSGTTLYGVGFNSSLTTWSCAYNIGAANSCYINCARIK